MNTTDTPAVHSDGNTGLRLINFEAERAKRPVKGGEAAFIALEHIIEEKQDRLKKDPDAFELLGKASKLLGLARDRFEAVGDEKSDKFMAANTDPVFAVILSCYEAQRVAEEQSAQGLPDKETRFHWQHVESEEYRLSKTAPTTWAGVTGKLQYLAHCFERLHSDNKGTVDYPTMNGEELAVLKLAKQAEALICATMPERFLEVRTLRGISQKELANKLFRPLQDIIMLETEVGEHNHELVMDFCEALPHRLLLFRKTGYSYCYRVWQHVVC